MLNSKNFVIAFSLAVLVLAFVAEHEVNSVPVPTPYEAEGEVQFKSMYSEQGDMNNEFLFGENKT